MRNKPSYKQAIREKCLDCTCFQKIEIQRCTVKTCSLWTIRPFMSIESHVAALQMRKIGVHAKVWGKGTN